MQKITITVAILLTALAVGCSRKPTGPASRPRHRLPVNCADAEVPGDVPPDAKYNRQHLREDSDRHERQRRQPAGDRICIRG